MRARQRRKKKLCLHPNVMEHLLRMFPPDGLANGSGVPALGASVFAVTSLALSSAFAWLSWLLSEKHFLMLEAHFEIGRS
jgi:hypothetical protein